MPTEYENGQIYLYDYIYDYLEKSFSTFYPKFSKSFEEIRDLFIYEEEHIKSKNKNKAVLNNE